MSQIEFVLFAILLAVCWMAKIGADAAYKNGVADGAGAVFEPRNPGYQRALEHLRKTMLHRLPELRRRLKEEKPEDWS